MKEFSEKLVSLQQNIQKHYSPIIALSQKFHNSIPNINPQVFEAVANLHSKIPTIDPVIVASIQRIAEQFQHIANTVKNVDFSAFENNLLLYIELLIKLEMPPIDIEYSEIKKLIAMEDISEAKETLIQHMIRKYDEQKINNILATWRLLHVAKKRIHIFEEVLWAHQNRKYNVSVPTLMAQFEGLICDITNSNRLQDGILKKHIENLLQSDDKYQQANISKEFWINVLLDNKSGKERFLSRHAILHGEDVNYGNSEKSLMLIIAMDAVLEWLNQVFEGQYDSVLAE